MEKNAPRKAFGISLLVLVVLVCVYLFLHSSIFNIGTIEVTGNEKVSRNEILALAGVSPGTNLFQVNREITQRSVKIHPMVKDAQIIRHLPRTIEIKVTERQSWAIIPYQEAFLLIDEEGVCIDKINELPNGNIPIITMDKFPERVNLGQAVHPNATKMVREVWKSLTAENRQNISQFHYVNKDQSLLLYTLKGTEVRFGNMDRLKEKAKNFSEVIKIESNLQKEGKDVLDYVDLRFKGQPVVKYRL